MTIDQAVSLPRAAGLVTVQLGPDLKRDWTQWCVDRGLVPGKALRSLVERALADGLELATSRSGVTVRVVVAKQPDQGSKVSRELQFTPSENAAIETVALAEGFAFQEWVIAAVRAALAKAPAHGQRELEALTLSNAHLAGVALELSAARRRPGGGDFPSLPPRLEADIRHHIETASAVLAQGVQRWQLKV